MTANIDEFGGPTLDVTNLQTHFITKNGIARAVDGVNFTVGKGEVMGLVGESGSGKTVTGFSLINLVDPPGKIVGGRILFNGKDLDGWKIFGTFYSSFDGLFSQVSKHNDTVNFIAK